MHLLLNATFTRTFGKYRKPTLRSLLKKSDSHLKRCGDVQFELHITCNVYVLKRCTGVQFELHITCNAYVIQQTF